MAVEQLAPRCRARYGDPVGNLDGEIPLDVLLDGRACEAESRYRWAAGGRVLTIFTVLPARGVAVELISTYVGHAQTPTVVTHLLLGPAGATREIRTEERPHEQLDPVEDPRACAYDHANELVEALRTAGFEVGVGIDERSFDQLERQE